MDPRDDEHSAPRRPPRGRPQRLPVDVRTGGGRSVDPRPRVAWLLAANRLVGETGRGLTRAEFIERMRAEGVVLDAPRVSRWESGQHGVPDHVVAAYERVLDLPRHSLQAAVRLVRPAEFAVAADLDGTDDGRRLDRLFSRVTRGSATGHDWRELAADLQHFHRVYLHPATWETVCDRLVAELTRASGDAFLQRFEAGTALMADPRSRRHLTLSIGRFVTDPDVQNVVPALWMLRGVRDEGATTLTQRLLAGASPMLSHAAVQVAASMLARGTWAAATEPLESVVVRGLDQFRDAAHQVDALDLAAHLPQEGLDRVLAATRGTPARGLLAEVRAHREIIERRRASRLADAVAEAAENELDVALHDPDLMLRALVREALFHVHWERRFVAGALLAHSPYRGPVRAGLLDLALEDDPVVSAMAWCALRPFAAGRCRDRLARTALDLDDDHTAARALVTAGLFVGDLSDPVVAALRQRLACDARPSQQHASLFVLGMAERLEPAAPLPEVVSDGAAWWRRTGGLLPGVPA